MAQDEKRLQKRNRITYMILSVVIAIAAWALVAFANDPDITVTFRDVDVVFKGEEELESKGLVVVKKSEIPSLDVKVTGKRSDLVDAIDKTVVEIDVSEITKSGEYNFKGNVILPNSGAKVDKVKFSAVPVTVDLYRTAEIPVRVMQTGYIEGKIVNSVPETDIVEIKGARSELELISYAVVHTDISMLTESSAAECGVQLVGSGGEALEELETVQPMLLEINNIMYDYRELEVKPVLHESLKTIHKIDYDKTTVKPNKVGVGVLKDTDIASLKVVIDEYNEGENEYVISPEEGVFIPAGSETVKVNLAFSEAEQADTAESE